MQCVFQKYPLCGEVGHFPSASVSFQLSGCTEHERELKGDTAQFIRAECRYNPLLYPVNGTE